MNDLPPIYAPLDERVAPLVHALRADGFRTTHSCDGHGYVQLPWVTLEARGFVPLIEWLRDHNVVANVAIVHTTLTGEAGFPFFRVEVLSDLSEAQL